MIRLQQRLRDGDWLTIARARLWAAAVLIASLAGLVSLLATSDGLNDYQGRPLGTDFSNTYVAGRSVLDGRPALPFDPPRQFERAREIFGQQTPMYGWHYPPYFFFLAAPLAAMPYLAALATWQGATLLLYLSAILALVRHAQRREDSAAHPGVESTVLLLALAFPAVLVNLGHGQNGFLTAALAAFALLWLDRRPVVAGVLFGLLAYKPQYGLLIPLVLAATGRWRTIVAAIATVAALSAAVTLAFGVETWRAFFGSLAFGREVLEHGGRWHMIQSVYAWVRLWGGDVALAYAMQAVTTLAVAAALVWLWRAPVDHALKAAALCIGMILATPYSIDYDMMILAPALAFFAMHGWQRGFAPYEKTALAAAWLAPLIARTAAEATLMPIGVAAMLALFAMIMRRARLDLRRVSDLLSNPRAIRPVAPAR